MSTSAVRLKHTRMVLILVVLLAVLVVGIIAGNSGQQSPPSTAASVAAPAAATQAPTAADPQRQQLLELARRDAADPRAIGAVDAPVVLIEFADFTCTYCAIFATETHPSIVREYVDAGKVRIEWRDALVVGEGSMPTAIASRAAAKQGKFWEFYAVMYEHTLAGSKDYSREALLALGQQVAGLDIAAFTAALDDQDLATAVQVEAARSKSLGVTSTPTFVLGGQVLLGAQPVDVFQQLIEQELSAASSN